MGARRRLTAGILSAARSPLARGPSGDAPRRSVLAFVEDPDGYKIEFIQKGTAGWDLGGD